MLIHLLIAAFAALTYWFAIRPTPLDEAHYHKLAQESLELRTRHALEEHPASQVRYNVQKDIWIQDEMRHFQIQSEESKLTLSLSQDKDKLEAVEELKKICCSIENEFNLTADFGLYTYPTHQFIAEKNCHLTQNQNYIDGKRIHLDLIQETVIYDHPIGRLNSIDFKAEKLFWDKKESKLYLNDLITIEQPGQFTILANRGILDLVELKPTLITLDGNVRLISSRIQDKESYAVADKLTYNPIDKTLLFSAQKKVLFWQEGLSLSASSVLIREDQTVEGHGDVHFAFDLEEQDYIEKLFKQYL